MCHRVYKLLGFVVLLKTPDGKKLMLFIPIAKLSGNLKGMENINLVLIELITLIKYNSVKNYLT